jgi:hypothetical protein
MSDRSHIHAPSILACAAGYTLAGAVVLAVVAAWLHVVMSIL